MANFELSKDARAGIAIRKPDSLSYSMPYLFNTPADTRAMLESIGVESVEQLFECIPEVLRLDRPLELPPAMSELELTQHMGALADRNLHAQSSVCFLGGGSYDHFIPAVVDAIASRGEFYTSYTPYQPEVSQGNLQAMFEYQTLICQLTGMDVSNASLYDGGSAVTEAALMSLAVSRGERQRGRLRYVASGIPSDPRDLPCESGRRTDYCPDARLRLESGSPERSRERGKRPA